MFRYELWLCDDHGRRMRLLENTAFFSYSRSVKELGTFSVGLPRATLSDMQIIFQPDWRVDVWRSPSSDIPLRREETYLLRSYRVYTRVDGVEILQYYGRSGRDLLNRRVVAQRPGTQWAAKSDAIDDMMKDYVREQCLYDSALDEDGVADNTRAYPEYEFIVQPNSGQGPTASRDFSGKTLRELTKELTDISVQLFQEDPDTYSKVYCDVVSVERGGTLPIIMPATRIPATLVGFEFQTYIGLRGIDRTSGIEFSMANENMSEPYFSHAHMDELTFAFVSGGGEGEGVQIETVEATDARNASRWNRVETFVQAAAEASTAAMESAGRAELARNPVKNYMKCKFLNNPGGPNSPRSMYGLDWDLGDLVRVNYGGITQDLEILHVYVGVDENGVENISGQSELNE